MHRRAVKVFRNQKMKEFSVLTWNTAKRLKRAPGQVEFIHKLSPDIIALQEIIPSTEQKLRSLLLKTHPHIISSFELVKDHSKLVKKRMFGQLIASRFPLCSIDPKNFDIPWTERVLSVTASIGDLKVDLHTTHIPPGSSNGWLKVEMIDGIVQYFKGHQKNPQILCGDFNTPQKETKSDGIITFSQRIKSDGEVALKKRFRGGLGADWDTSERSLFTQLNSYGLRDAYREQNPDDLDAFSWSFRRNDKEFKTRFDHMFVDQRLRLSDCEFMNDQGSLSDHSPLLVKMYI